ncbi:glycosyltransferase family 4 protein [Brevibacterium antiquum]|uniref:D-inositol 3-phosphate glycosyltransferase n=1 Tax=Brevibacterium antiquum CNRZ 918 TaxID=1255637 RepID=A0A2H1KZJ9_9MICO|nr:glycosyltransferase family 4 protein [Brevibacterium antiquum]SMY05186.1 Glycosyltransferase involved in cell wall bisynthesis [Brevibacterium antiquum CNRZ 918]HCG56531.1 hypothetical protein [Brevibacterium sp.]
MTSNIRSGSSATPVIMHMVDCYHGGVARAINDMVANAPQVHHVIAFHGDDTPPSGLFTREFEVTGGALSRMRTFRRLLRDSDASIAHVHSSWAGGFLRVGRMPSRPLIYQPHCYKFVDPNLSRAQSFGIRLIERLLLANTTVTVALSPAERSAAAALGPTPVRVVPNVPSVPPGTVDTDSTSRRRIIMVGRVSHQKDPEFFERVVRKCRELRPDVEAVWVGDGDPQMVCALRSAGVRVTGWLETPELANLLSEGGVYIHSAHYEGLPLSVLDAVQRGLPVALRRIPSLTGVLEERQSDSPKQLAAEAVRLFNNAHAYREVIEQTQPWLEEHSNSKQRQALHKLYESLITT